MRVAVIGCGSIGRRHIGNLLALGCEVEAFDPSPEAIQRVSAEYPTAQARMPGVAYAPTPPAHAVVIAGPYDTHLRYVEEAVMARLPFFVEKPLGSLDQLPRWREIAAMTLPTNQVGYMLRFHAKAKALKVLFPAPDGGSFDCYADTRTWPGRSYGPFLLEASHELDLALWLGCPSTVHAVYPSTDSTRVDLKPAGQTRVRWQFYYGDRSAHYYRNWHLDDDDDLGADVTFRSPDDLGTEMYRDELAHFLACVRDQTPTLCPLADGLRVLEVCAQVEALTCTTR